MVFISPRIIRPRLKGGTTGFTDKKLAFAECDLNDNLSFESLRDPITRWFFQPNEHYGHDVVEDFTSQAAFKENSGYPDSYVEENAYRVKTLNKRKNVNPEAHVQNTQAQTPFNTKIENPLLQHPNRKIAP